MKEFEKNKIEFAIFLKKDRGYSNQTIESYSRDLNVYHNFVKKNKIQYNKIKKEDIFKFQSSLEGQISPRSFARILSALKTFYKFLHMERAVDDITLNEIKLYPSPKYKKSMPTFLSKEQVEKIVEKIDLNEKLDNRDRKKDQAIIMLFFSSGIRLNELISIKLSDIDFSNNKIKVFGKGKKQRIVNFDNYTKDLVIQYLEIIEKYPLVKELYNNNLFVDKKNKPLKE
ncbi:MAG: site-specific integrase, partial [Candidatus Neomarinimicrobiota bacterium]|nr:site-specific integrase [Candidatus Neomarinimicrobiota bacterium]